MTCSMLSNGQKSETMEDKDLRQAFTLFDVNRDGQITASELGSVLGFLGINATPEEISRMIADADTNGNGTVEFEEFLKMMRRYAKFRKSQAPMNEEDRLELEMMEAFKVFDHNNDNVIDFEEIKRTMHFLGEAVTNEEVRAMIREADLEQKGYVNYNEFKIMMMKARGRQVPKKRHSSRNRSSSSSANNEPGTSNGPCNGKL